MVIMFNETETISIDEIIRIDELYVLIWGQYSRIMDQSEFETYTIREK